jgi:serine/threonine protein kinase/tetratricopeptide (TPR) repeat protein
MTNLTGKKIFHYRIIEQVGQGGMGNVYKAEDTKLNNIVALKFLPLELNRDQEAKQRFLNEARAARKLEHPNICTIYDIDESEEGQVFISMPLYEGGTLEERIEKGSLSIDEAIEFASNIAEALGKAHNAGIVHRDIKPSNIMFTQDGILKVVDFGIAKISTEKMTIPGTTMGTLAYMSPEQLRGEEVDRRTDIWALGVILYEMLTGQHPFRAENEQAMFLKILNEPAKPIADFGLDIPSKLIRVLEKTMEKEPDDRYQDIAEMITALEGFKPAPPTPTVGTESTNGEKRKNKRKRIVIYSTVIFLLVLVAGYICWKYCPGKPMTRTIAVIPLKNLSTNAAQDYFAEGVTEALIGALGKIEKIQVISLTSVLQYKDTEKSIPEIADELGVQYVVEGSVQRSGNRIRISVLLINASPEHVIWPGSYDSDQKDVLTLYGEFSQSIAEQIKIKLTAEEQERLRDTYVVNPDAYDTYLRGRYNWNKRTPETLGMSIELFQKAIEQDPALAPAYSGLADALALFGSLEYGVYPPKEVMPRAKDAALTSIRLDPLLAEGHTSLANILLFYDWDWEAAKREFEKAIDLKPNYPTAHHWYGTYFITLGKFKKAFDEIKIARNLDPYSRVISVDEGWFHQYAREYNEAVQDIQKTLELEPDFIIAHLNLGFTYTLKGKYDEAIQSFRRAKELSGDYPLSLAALSYSLAVAGREAEAMELLGKLNQISEARYVPALYFGLIYMGLGDKDQAFYWMDKAFEERSGYLLYLKVDPKVDSLRGDPRFNEVLKKIGFK